MDDDQHEGGNSDELQSAQDAATSTPADADDAADDGIELYREEYIEDSERKIHIEYVEGDAHEIHVVAIDAPLYGPIAPSLYGPIAPPWPSSRRALHPLTDDDLCENIDTLRDQVMRLFGEREARHFAPALAGPSHRNACFGAFSDGDGLRIPT